MTELILDWAEECFIAGNIREAYSLAETAKTLDPFFGSVDKYVAAYAVHVAMQKKTPTGEINYYGVLGVDTSADISKINERFRSVAPLVNPDENCSAAAKEAHRQVRIARHLLSCPPQRREYDIRAGFPVSEEIIKRPRCVSNGADTPRTTICC